VAGQGAFGREPNPDQVMEAAPFLACLQLRVDGLKPTVGWADKIAQALRHYDRTVEHPNIGGASGDADWDAE
jgi:hypothetical protein